MASTQANSANRPQAEHANKRLSEIQHWLVGAVADRTRLPRAEIQIDEPIYRYGIDSLERVNLAYELERWIGFAVDESTLADLETIEEVAVHLIDIESMA